MFDPDDRSRTQDTSVLVESVASKSQMPSLLESSNLPVLTIPDYGTIQQSNLGNLALVAVEGRDRRIADSVTQLLNPERIGLALVHVTWLTGIVTSPLGEDGLDNPDPYDLLLYQGAHEALVSTAERLESVGFSVSTHLRNHREPAVALHRVILQAEPALAIMGLGKHGAGIGHQLQQLVPVPVLYVSSR